MSVLFRCLTLVAFLALLPSALVAQQRTVSVTLLLICDLYEMSEGPSGRGGLARVAAAIRQERLQRDNVVVVHAGDAISPSLMFSHSQ